MKYYTNTTAKRFIYCFEFAICDGKMTIPVYSFDMSHIILFINQHGFKYDECKDFIREVEFTEEVESKSFTNELKLFIFKSNKNKEKFSVMTTESLVERCVVNAGDVITNACWFGPLLAMSKQPIVKILNDLIDELKYATVMDFQSFGDDELMEYNMDTDYNTDIIRESIINRSMKYNHDTEPQPITIESYISGFTGLL